MLPQNRLDIERDHAQRSFNQNSGHLIVKKESWYRKMRKYLKFPKTEDSQDYLDEQSTSSFELKDLLVYGLKKYAKFTSTLKRGNTHVIEVSFPIIHVTANYDMVDFQFKKEKLNANGEMDLVFHSLKAKIIVSTVKDYRQNTLKKISPNVQLKYTR